MATKNSKRNTPAMDEVAELNFNDDLLQEDEMPEQTEDVSAREYRDSLDEYVRKVCSGPVPGAVEMQELVVKAKAGDLEARNKVIVGNVRLALKVVMGIMSGSKGARARSIPPEDIVQHVAVEGVIAALEKFDPSRNLKFSTYLLPWFQQRADRYIGDNKSTIRIPHHLQRDITKARCKIEKLEKEGASPEELQAARQEFNDIVSPFQDVLTQKHDELDAPIAGPGNDKAKPLSEVLAAPDAWNQTPEAKVCETQESQKLNEMLDMLPQRQAHLIRRRFGLGQYEESTLAEIAAELGMTRQRADQLVSAGMKRLAELMVENGMKPCFN